MATIVLDENTESIQYLCSRDKRLAKVISMVGPIEYCPHTENPYAFLVHEIIEQMLSVKAGTVIYGRLSALCNDSVTPQAIDALTIEEIKSIGTSATKAASIKDMTSKIISGELDLSSFSALSDDAVIKQLLSLRGIGLWTAKMYLIFVLNRPDVLPYEDVAFLQAYGWMYKTDDRSKETVQKKCSKWKPYSSIAARFLYRALDTGLTKEAFHLRK